MRSFAKLGEKDCAYYMRTGSCKFGATCKFNHPQPAAVRALVAMSGSSMYAANGSSAAASPQPFQGIPSWSMPRTPYIPRSRFQAPSTFAPLIVQAQNMVSMPGWGAYQARMGPQQQVLGGASFVYGTGSLNEAPSGGIHTTYTPYVPGSAATGLQPALQSAFMANDSTFPERPGQPDCQYYMKTGDCKYGMACRYHHPKDRVSFIPNCILNPLGLPIRQGVEKCAFYMQYGTCKFGPTCKFDHPTNHLAYSPSASSLMDLPVAPYPVALPVAVPMPTSDSTAQGPILFHKRLGTVTTDKQQGLNDPYPDVSAGESSVSSSKARSSSAGSNGSLNAEMVEMQADSSQDASNSPL
ncbi:hypothetical protein L7F22_009001 [Adiantum nelumboides]|nr:hypothetical protein [Adiantum nelumboides]